ncbi:MAG: hypothetical protein ACR2OC_11400 [Solirubrobacterales bacterium]
MEGPASFEEPPRRVVGASVAAEGQCPACGGPLYAWISAPAAAAGEDEVYVLDRCERCGASCARESAVHPGFGADAAAADREVGVLLAASGGNGSGLVSAPNRRSLQAAIGEGNWAALDLPDRPLQLTAKALEELLERRGAALERVRFPVFGRNQLWMWQTLMNALTFHPNFAREVRAGRLRPANSRGTLIFTVDSIVSVLGAPLVALASIPLEAVAALVRRGGELRATVRPPADAALDRGVSD